MKLYQHYKGGLYIVTEDDAAPATNSDPLNPDTYVIYQDLDGQVFTREFAARKKTHYETRISSPPTGREATRRQR